MEFDLIDEPRTRVQVQSGSFTSPSPHRNAPIDRKQVAFSLTLAVLILAGASITMHGWELFLLLWLAMALALGPFAPPSFTGGECRVGIGPCLPELEKEEVELDVPNRRSSSRKHVKTENGDASQKFQTVPPSEAKNADAPRHEDEEEDESDSLHEEEDCDGVVHDEGDVDHVFDYPLKQKLKTKISAVKSNAKNAKEEEAAWTPEDEDLLRKLIQKYPRGMLKRWEVIAEAFDGRHSIESTVRMSKALSEKKTSDDNAYSKFISQRKGSANVIDSPLSQRWDADAMPAESVASKELEKKATIIEEKDAAQFKEEEKRKNGWTDAEDKALLHALKSFPKDTSMRWEKVALAVPGRTKPQCFKRYAELRESFRHNKADKVK